MKKRIIAIICLLILCIGVAVTIFVKNKNTTQNETQVESEKGDYIEPKLKIKHGLNPKRYIPVNNHREIL